MLNSIVSHFSQTLKNHYRDKKLTSQQQIFLDELNGKETLLELSLFIEVTYKKNRKKAFFTSGNFSSLLENWMALLQEINQLHNSVHEVLGKLAPPEKCTALITLIEQLLAHPKTLIHCEVLTLFKALHSPQLQEMLDYLATLPAASITRQQGSFLSFAGNESYQACSVLLNNLASAFSENDERWMLGNRLLQSALHIYHDLPEQTLEQDYANRTSQVGFFST